MFKKIYLILFFVFFGVIFTAASAFLTQNAIAIESPLLSKTQINDIAQIALKKSKIDVSPKGKYSILKVLVNETTMDNPYLLIFLQHRFYFLSTILRVDLNSQFEITSLQNHYKILPEEKPKIFRANTDNFQCPDDNVKFLFASPVNINGTQSVKNALNLVYPAAIQKYGVNGVKVLIEDEDTLANFSNYLSCPNLEGVFSTSSHTEIGQSFFVSDGEFDYTFFTRNKDDLKKIYANKMITFNTCYAFDNTSPGLCKAITELSPKIYTSGVTPLLIWGGPETYACFWEKILAHNAKPTKELLNYCAQENDPSVPNSRAPLYILGAHNWDDGDNSFYPTTITTNLGAEYNLDSRETYLRLNLKNNERIEKITLQIGDKKLACPTNSNLFKINGLRAVEFLIYQDYETQECGIMELKTDESDQFPKGHSVYGLFPEDQCQSTTSKYINKYSTRRRN